MNFSEHHRSHALQLVNGQSQNLLHPGPTVPAQPGPKKRAASVAIPPAHPLASADTAAAEASTPPAPGDPALPSASRNNRWLDARTRLLEEMRSSNQSILSEDALENAQSQEPVRTVFHFAQQLNISTAAVLLAHPYAVLHMRYTL